MQNLLRQNSRGATLIEIMAMLVVLSLVLATMFATLIQGINFSRDTEARIQAINIAREGIEAVMNIRNTNWLRFPSNRTKCWDADKGVACLSNPNPQKILSGSYVLKQAHGLWFLSWAASWDTYSNSFVRYNIGVNKNGWYVDPSSDGVGTQQCNIINKTNCRSMFAREIQIREKTESGMIVEARVYWRNTAERKVSLTAEITNWKSHYDPNK